MNTKILTFTFTLLSSSLSFGFPLGEYRDNIDLKKISCQNYPDCEAQAKICGFLAGLEIGTKVCNGEAEPNPDYVWSVKEITTDHCIGYLPIGDARTNAKLETAFKTNYTRALEAFKASCK
jgi:hypothetical protein